jgi:leader peptidase (prepilin peptidase)/N-methyltransferase
VEWSAHAGAVGAIAGLCGLAGLLVPTLIARVPEPPASEEETDEAPKELYVDISRRPRLALFCAAASVLAGGLVGLAVGWSWPLIYLVPVVPLLVALSAIDFRTRLLPTKLITPGYAIMLVGLVIAWIATRDTADLIRAGLGWLIAGGVFFLLWAIYPRGMGYGDVRLSGVLGLALGSLGWAPLLVGIYAGFLIFGLPGLLLAVVRWDRALLKTSFPFGPFMIIGALLGIVWGTPIAARLAGG